MIDRRLWAVHGEFRIFANFKEPLRFVFRETFHLFALEFFPEIIDETYRRTFVDGLHTTKRKWNF